MHTVVLSNMSGDLGDEGFQCKVIEEFPKLLHQDHIIEYIQGSAEEHITLEDLVRRFGMTNMQKTLPQMADNWLPKQFFFGELI